MQISEEGIGFIKGKEELRLSAYDDGGGVWTIGWGHTKDVRKGDVCTEDQALAWLHEDLAPAEAAVARLVKVELTQSMYDALVSFVFNVGVKAFADSLLLEFLNKKDFWKIPEQLCRWRHDGGKPVRGLLIRRLEEGLLFMKEKF